MGLFGGKKEEKYYLVVDAYSDEVIATCSTKETKQIAQVQSKARFVECTDYEMFKYNEHKVIPDDMKSRTKYAFKDLK